MSTIQRFPSGLLPLLSVKASETPNELSKSVQATLDTLPFYLADRLYATQASSLTVSSVLTVTLPVPQGEYWYVWAITGLANNITAGSAVKLAVGVQTPQGIGPQLNAMQAPVTSVSGEGFAIVGVPPPGFIMPPGSLAFASTLVDPGAGSLDLYVRVLVSRLQTQA